MSRFGPVLALVLMAAPAWVEGRALLVLTATGQLWCADTDSGDENPPWIRRRSPVAYGNLPFRGIHKRNRPQRTALRSAERDGLGGHNLPALRIS